MGRTNIITCRGDVPGRNDYASSNAEPGKPNYPSYVQGTSRALFIPFQWRTMASVVDGTSNTIAFSETVTTESELEDRRVRGGVLVNFSPSGYDWNLGPQACFLARSGNELNNASGGSYAGAYRGNRVLDGRICVDGFATMLPPNAPSCHPSTSLMAGWSSLTANSYHGGGVNAARVDGSVFFVSETIDCGKLSSAPNFTGPSAYGVWGAYGSINGGESTSI